ncbi:MAG TPA: hypothetical protein VFQ45_13295 [Longimicrobium sp.]|nr:hypothetical protein [Longimicrobium sp.]
MPATPRWTLTAAGCAALLLAALPAHAQRRGPTPGPLYQPHVAIGYVVNAPNMYVGVSGRVMTGFLGGLGLYVDAKFDTDSPRDEANFADSLTVAEVEDRIPGQQVFSDEAEWRSFNLALVRPVTTELMVYAGAGLAKKESYRQYFDVDRERGIEGFYWVEDEANTGDEVNFLAGAFFRLAPQISAQFGFETAPRGITVGVTYNIPFGR